MSLVNWQYCHDLNTINMAIQKQDSNWYGLTSANQIISITYDNSHECYVVFWQVRKLKENQKRQLT